MNTTSAQQVGADAAARALGNALYRAGNLTQAEKAYKKAALLAPQDPSPISNLSAVKYEMGDYRAAIAYIQKAISLAVSGTDDDDAKKDKLYSRMAKSYLHLLDLHSAEEAISAIGDGHVRAELHESAESIKALSEYFCMGHDAVDFFKDHFGTKGAGSPDVSFLFAGSGEGRHVFSAIFGLMLREDATERPCFGKLHFTLVDLKPAALAKVLISFDMMIRGETELSQGDPRGHDYFLDMAYLFSCQIVPPWVEARLQTSIRELIKRLEGKGDVLEFVFVPENDRKPLARVLRPWQHPWPGLSNAQEVRNFVKQRLHSERVRAEALFVGKCDRRSKSEKADFGKITVMLPPAAVAERRETSLVKPLADYRSTGKIKGLRQHIRSNWRVNNTLMDYDSAEAVRRHRDTDFNAIEFDPLEVTESMGAAPPPRGEGDSSSLEKLAMVFRGFSTSTFGFSIEDRLVVELIIGEVADIMERIRYKILHHRLSPPRGSSMLDPTLFPHTFDHVHMSPIPDYIGGHITSYLAGRSLLKEDQPSSLGFVNLLNSPELTGDKTIQSEYLLMHDMQHIRRHFVVNRRPGELMRRDLPQIFEILPMLFTCEGYMLWDRMPNSKMSFEHLLPKPEFEKWIHAHLFKICLPYPRPIFSGQPVYAPLNLTALIRLAIDMFEVGYPAHWLLRILSRICTGVITTRARPPTKSVSDPAGVDAKRRPAREMTVQPWVPELTTLLSIWRRLLPFGTDSLSGTLVPLASIAKYSITFPTVRAESDHLPHFILLFWNTEVGSSSCPPDNIYELLVNGDAGGGGDNSTSARDIRKRGIVCVTTFRYIPASRTAEFWMRADKMEDMIAGAWNAFIWRTDAWEAVTGGIDISTGVVAGEKWTMVS
ncbi:hypothetical protein C2857_003367 [Epichloe festucae Fl1]|uniref:DUF4470 domain-containing protein n=1 Tax=Epichloe festucae (strain Fl1) TaxID=877507 RepID=A0A7U3Q0E5_EPIFF|nr:hypothetical protein C2857_003367 [Epichloe festucae Fl1]